MDETVSIIVPVYNVSEYLPHCMKTLCAQTVEGLEIILIDDGSTDGSGAECDRYAAGDSRICVIHKENGGLSSARNAGLSRATGEYICFVDPDDYVETNLVEAALSAISEGAYDLCVYRTRHTYGSTVELIPGLDEKTMFRWRDEKEQADFFASVFFPYKIAWGVCGRMFRRRLIEENGLRFVSERVVFAEDLLFTYSYLLCASSLVYIPDCLYHYVSRVDSLINTKKREQVLPKYNRLMQNALQYTQQKKAAQIAEDFPVFYTILMGTYAKNLWWHQRLFTVQQIRAQFLASEDLDFMQDQIRLALENPEKVCRSQGRISGKILLAHMRYIQSGSRLRFWTEMLLYGSCLRLQKGTVERRDGKQQNRKIS